MTTVLGLTPLLFERSSQAQFLKPTVITLVYGLGFGMILVLLVVPALVAMQQDVARQMTALRRALRSTRASGLRAVMGLAVLAMLGWLGATMGWVIYNGEIAPQITSVLPMLGELPAMPVAFGLFVGGMVAVVLLAFIGLSVGLLSGQRRTIHKA
jgi:Cu/Ag efflux pump CusA